MFDFGNSSILDFRFSVPLLLSASQTCKWEPLPTLSDEENKDDVHCSTEMRYRLAMDSADHVGRHVSYKKALALT